MVKQLTASEAFDMITDKDGSCRDVNFSEATWAGLTDFLTHLAGCYRSIECLLWGPNEDPADISHDAIVAHLGAVGSSAQLTCSEDTALVQHLQVFLVHAEDGAPFIELTFFPEDVRLEVDTVSSLLDMISGWMGQLQATRYYLRYENVSWESGDVSNTSGVILTSETKII